MLRSLYISRHERVDDEASEILERVEREQIDLTFESYLYPAGMTHLAMMLPMEFQTGTPADMIANLENPEVRENRSHACGKNYAKAIKSSDTTALAGLSE